MSSDSDSTDSDKGIRYKTENTRVRVQPHPEYAPTVHSRHKSSSHRHKKMHKKERTHSSDDDEYYRRRKNKSHRKRHSRDGSRLKDKLSDEEKSPHKTSNATHELNTSPDITKVDDLKELNASFGPALPPHLQQKLENKVRNSEEDVSEISTLGPVLPLHSISKLTKEHSESNIIKDEEKSASNAVCGPALPLILIPQESLKEENKPSTIGPALPPHLVQKPAENNAIESEENTSVIGPVLPLHLKQKVEENQDEEIPTSLEESDTEKILGPILPPQFRQQLLEESSSQQPDEDDDVYGPLPPGANFSRSHIELEERALQMRINQLDAPTDKEPVREEWMLELPPAAASFGLGPRTFRTKERPDFSDRSSWTDTPEDKARKKAGKEEIKIDVKEESRLKDLQRRDQEQEEIIKKSKRTKKSLLELHTKKLKKKNEDEGPTERRPFSREIDLQVNRFDDAQKKAVLKKAQLLDDRFSAGESKFL